MKKPDPVRIRKSIKKHRYALAAFFLPCLVLTGAFAATGIYPFGENQITIIDMYHQYVPFLSELQYKLQHGGSLLYSWDGAGGFNFWTLLAYYGASPLNLLLALFPSGLIVEAVTLILVLKVGFSGMFQYLYLRRTYPRTSAMPAVKKNVDNWAGVAFGTMYALSAYFTGYFWCIMWIDVMALLPLCILGLRRLVEDGRPVMYCVSLALIIFCNYYIAIMMCIFIVLYYLVIYLEKRREGGIKDFLVRTVYVALCSCIGAAMACIMFFPTWRAMQNAYYYADSMPEEWSFYHDPMEIVNQLLPNAHVCFRDGLPNLYCGLFVVIMLILYFVSRTIPFRTKVVHGLLLALFFFSLNVNKLDFIWHGLHFPNELPFRYSFVISFVLVGMAYQAYLRLNQVPGKIIMAALAGILGYYLIAAKVLGDVVDNKEEFFYLGIGFLFLLGLVLVLHNRKVLPDLSTSRLLVLIIAAEMLCSTALAFDKAGNVLKEDYISDRTEMEELVKQTRGEMVRVEKMDETLMNMPAAYHYRGMSQFASCLNANATELMEAIGLDGTPGNNRYNYVPTTPVVHAMLNIKYLISGDETVPDSRFILKDQVEMASLYENSQPMSMGYMLPDSIRLWETFNIDPFKVQNDFVAKATSNIVPEVFTEIAEPVVESEELEIEDTGTGTFETTEGEGKAGTVTLSYAIKEPGDYYVFAEADMAETIQVIVSDGRTMDIRDDCGSAYYVGELAEGEDFDVQITYEQDGQGNITTHACKLDDAAWDKAYGMISKNRMEVTDFGDRFIEGVIYTPRRGIFTTSVLYEDGWKLYVDGKETEIDELVGGDFIAAELSAGDHKIRLKYTPAGFIPGVLLTMIGILALAGLVLLRRWLMMRSAAPKTDQIGDRSSYLP